MAMFDLPPPMTDAQVQAGARPVALCPCQALPCPLCQADYPGRPLLWGWIEVAADSPGLLEMCGDCEADPRQRYDYAESE